MLLSGIPPKYNLMGSKTACSPCLIWHSGGFYVSMFVCLCVQMNVGYVYVNVCVWNACVHKCVDVYSSVSCLVNDILAFPPPR